MSEKTRKILRIIAWILFGVYLLFLCYFLFFAEILGRTYSGRSYHYNLVPFKEIMRFWTYRKNLGLFAVMVNLFGNMIAFFPFGMLLPLLSHKCRHFWQVTLLSFDFSLMVEIIQLISKVGSFDVDDLLLNTVGGAVGFLAFILADRIRNRYFRRK